MCSLLLRNSTKKPIKEFAAAEVLMASGWYLYGKFVLEENFGPLGGGGGGGKGGEEGERGG